VICAGVVLLAAAGVADVDIAGRPGRASPVPSFLDSHWFGFCLDR
jgi:hypothetical protein